jgi:hypothetical protein
MISKYKKVDSRKYTIESLLLPEKEADSSTCMQILGEYKRVLEEALRERDVRPKVIMNLTEEMSAAIVDLFEVRNS